MANYWVSSELPDGDNDGTSPANAIRGTAAIRTGFIYNHAAGTKVWVRRSSSYDEGIVSLNQDIAPVADGTIDNPIYLLSWPRGTIPNTTITESDWTNGSELVENVVGITPSIRGHLGRWCTAPDGHKYLLTAILIKFTIDGMAEGAEFAVGEILTNTTQTKKGKVWKFTDNLDTTGTIWAVVDSATTWVNNDNITSDGGGDAELSADAVPVGFLIDREYAGGTVTGIDGKFQIEADEYFDDRPQEGIDAGWDADSHDLPFIDFNNESLDFVLASDLYYSVKNFYFMDSNDTQGIFYTGGCGFVEVVGCIFKQTSRNVPLLSPASIRGTIDRFIIEGSGEGASQKGVGTGTLDGYGIKVMNGSIYNCGDYGYTLNSPDTFINVNIGIEMANGNEEIYLRAGAFITGFDIKLGGTNGYIYIENPLWGNSCKFENYQKILGYHKTFFFGGVHNSVAVTSTSANKKLSDNVLQIFPNLDNVPAVDSWKQDCFVGNFDLLAGAHTLGYWIFNNTGDTLNVVTARDNLYLEGFFVDSYDDISEYTITKVFSTETNIIQAGDANAWVLLTLSFTLATAGRVKVYLKVAKYEASAYILLDPKTVIT